ncbi:MAG TPA: hypothetical protein VK966_09805 [Longimicrobiales bacterium]|nr:hypothetical protein [Longimicrobiales bacterium]
MSRAFVKEDGGDFEPTRTFGLPPADDPSYDAAATMVLLEAARDGHIDEAERATGYRWGDVHLKAHVQALLDKELERPEEQQDRRYIRMARRWLRG